MWLGGYSLMPSSCRTTRDVCIITLVRSFYLHRVGSLLISWPKCFHFLHWSGQLTVKLVNNLSSGTQRECFPLSNSPPLVNSIHPAWLFTSAHPSTYFLLSCPEMNSHLWSLAILMSSVCANPAPFLRLSVAKAAECRLSCIKVSASVLPH